MDARLLGEAHAVFVAAREARIDTFQRIPTELRDSVTRAEQLSDDIKELNCEIDRQQAEHDQMQEHILRKRRHGGGRDRFVKKTKSNRRRRDKYGAEAAELRRRRDELQRMLDSEQGYRKDLRDQYDLAAVQRRYYVARHLYLLATAKYANSNSGALERKCVLMRMAEIPLSFTVKEVWHYEQKIDHGDQVHFFFGGGINPETGEVAPDGVGHGHYVLTLRESCAPILRRVREPRA